MFVTFGHYLPKAGAVLITKLYFGDIWNNRRQKSPYLFNSLHLVLAPDWILALVLGCYTGMLALPTILLAFFLRIMVVMFVRVLSPQYENRVHRWTIIATPRAILYYILWMNNMKVALCTGIYDVVMGIFLFYFYGSADREINLPF